jgi:hypothetical protein
MSKSSGSSYTAALMVSCIILSQSLTGCGGSSTTNTSNLPPVDDSNRSSANTAPAPVAHKGMSTGQKVVLLAGAAALYYMYRKNQEAHASGKTGEPQYYLSKNGRVYYREAGGRVHWVTPPKEGVMVPSEEANQYQEFEGYQGKTSGRDLAGIGSAQ